MKVEGDRGKKQSGKTGSGGKTKANERKINIAKQWRLRTAVYIREGTSGNESKLVFTNRIRRRKLLFTLSTLCAPGKQNYNNDDDSYLYVTSNAVHHESMVKTSTGGFLLSS